MDSPELLDRLWRMLERPIRSARLPVTMSRDSFSLMTIAKVNNVLVIELDRCQYVSRRDGVIVVGKSCNRKTHLSPGVGRVACRIRMSVAFIATAGLVNELM